MDFLNPLYDKTRRLKHGQITFASFSMIHQPILLKYLLDLSIAMSLCYELTPILFLLGIVEKIRGKGKEKQKLKFFVKTISLGMIYLMF